MAHDHHKYEADAALKVKDQAARLKEHHSMRSNVSKWYNDHFTSQFLLQFRDDIANNLLRRTWYRITQHFEQSHNTTTQVSTLMKQMQVLTCDIHPNYGVSMEQFLVAFETLATRLDYSEGMAKQQLLETLDRSYEKHSIFKHIIDPYVLEIWKQDVDLTFYKLRTKLTGAYSDYQLKQSLITSSKYNNKDEQSYNTVNANQSGPIMRDYYDHELFYLPKGQYPTTNMRKGKSGAAQCTHCDKTSHFVDRCNQKYKCPLCNQTGHSFYQCAKFENKNNSNNDNS